MPSAAAGPSSFKSSPPYAPRRISRAAWPPLVPAIFELTIVLYRLISNFALSLVNEDILRSIFFFSLTAIKSL